MPAFLLYIDPTAPGLIVQGIVATCLGVVVFFKTIKYKVLSIFGRHKTPSDAPPSESQVHTDSEVRP